MSDENEGSTQDTGRVNWRAAREAAAGDESLLAELVEMFANAEAPSLIADIDRAITSLDPVLLQRAAHTLKGSLRIFECSETSEFSLQLEQLGKEQLRKIAIEQGHAAGPGGAEDREASELEKIGKTAAAKLDAEQRQHLLEQDMHRAREVQARLNQTLPPVLEEMRDFLNRRGQ
jgi:HPt (histidine-containing phosphotransfer) domain-containing protein